MQITALNIYPIKGCRGVPLTSVAVDRLGLADDRRLMLVDARDRFLSQRELPALATLVPTIDAGVLTVSAPAREPFRLAIDLDAPSREVRVWWEHAITAADQGDDAAAWFSDAAGRHCRLVAFGHKARNPVDPEYSPLPAAETAFTDGYPILAVLHESLVDLNTRLETPIPMERFRPSVVISGARAWSEDDWTAMTIGEVDCDAVKPCGRCVVTTTDQVTGAKHERQEPLRTLATFRTIPHLGAIFGQNVVPRTIGTLRLGDRVELM